MMDDDVLELQLLVPKHLFSHYKQLHVYGQMDVCHAHSSDLCMYDGIRVRLPFLDQKIDHILGKPMAGFVQQ